MPNQNKSSLCEKKLAEILRKHYDQVVSQWSTSKDASDAFKRDEYVYAPRPDIGVGPFSIEPGNKFEDIVRDFENKTPRQLKDRLSPLNPNKNPRCLLSIEIVFSGSSKHILGDITNSSIMGLYGVVVTTRETHDKVMRVFKFLKKVKDKKIPSGPMTLQLFDNILIIETKDLLKLLQ